MSSSLRRVIPEQTCRSLASIIRSLPGCTNSMTFSLVSLSRDPLRSPSNLMVTSEPDCEVVSFMELMNGESVLAGWR